MSNTPFFNLINAETEHCFAWLVGSGVIDPPALVAESRQKATTVFDTFSADEKEEIDREKYIEDHTCENLTEAVEELFQEHLGDVHPEVWGHILGVGAKCENDPQILIDGLAGCAWHEVCPGVIAKALMLYVKNTAAETGSVEVPSTGTVA